ncbi:hypothetical protein [Thiococcus pfennigii]|jgi:hypothetical protein|uniref:hypothetical protein n=1 Tax=Thiococcus pfennigii TaxID=1057 RepID=UPI0019042016|nr:hypothetical protein [Thiococcus pfennigii]MBK1730797.1 hypothetical protein [Thiococcus pfennigii]
MQKVGKAIVDMGIVTSVVFAVSSFAVTAKAVECDPEPTDMFVEYSESITCDINPEADTDIFRIVGGAGDRVLIEALDDDPDRFQTSIYLVAPDGATVKSGYRSIEATLPETGTYTARVHDTGHDDTGDYVFTTYCLSGACSPIPPEVCDQNGDGQFTGKDAIEFWKSCR